MRRTVVALVVAALALTVAGCASKTPPKESPAIAEATLPPPQPPVYLTDKSANDQNIPPVAFPEFEETSTPAVFTDRLKAGRPMVIVFYDTSQDVTDDQLAEVASGIGPYRGLVDLITFDVYDNPAVQADGAVIQGYVQYATELGVDQTPYIIVVDRGGFIIWRWKGYVDRGYIGREVKRATM